MRIVSALLLACVASAQIQDVSAIWKNPTVRAQASATVTEKPDQLRIDIGVVTQAQTALAAGSTNATQFAEVVAELKRNLDAGSQVQTISYTITPNYRYPKEGGTPTIAGYTATNIVRVTSGDVSAAGKIIDAATRTGANNIRSIEFSVKNEEALRAKALAEASRQARASAEAMAGGVGLRISRIVRIEDISPGDVRPMREMAMMASARAAAAPPTPVEAGTIRVEVTVVLTAEVGP